MGKYLTWYYLFLKLNIKNKSVYIQLLSMLLVVLLIINISIPTNENVKVLLYNEGGDLAMSLVNKLEQADTVYQFEEVDDIKIMHDQILSKEAECGFVIHDGFEERVSNEGFEEKVSADDLDGIFTMVSSSLTSKGEVAKEIFYAHFFKMYSELKLRDSLDGFFENKSEEEKEELYHQLLNKNEKYLQGNTLFKIQYEIIEAKSEDEEEAHISKVYPIRGIICIILFLGILLERGKSVNGNDDEFSITLIGFEKYVYLILKYIGGITFQTILALILILNFAEASGFFYEGLALLLFILLTSIWVLIFGQVINKSTTYSGWMLTLILTNVIVCPVFFDLAKYIKVFDIIQLMFPLGAYLKMF